MNSICEDCDSLTKIKLSPYGAHKLAQIDCPNCGVSYDTNISDEDVKAIRNDLRRKNYYRVRTVVRVMFWMGVLALTYTLATHINWTENGYCWGTLTECYLGGM